METKLKAKLMPYLFQTAINTSQTGISVMRSMVMEFMDDRNCSYLDKQYLLGESLLVAPIFNENSIAELLIDDEDDLVKLFLLYNNNLKYEAIGELIDNIDLSKETFKPAYDVLFDIVCGIMFIHSQAGKILNKLQEHNAETKELLFGKICPTTRAQMLREISEEANKQFQKIKSY